LIFRVRYEASKVFFLLASFTDSYAASRKQQSVQLFPGCGDWQVTSAVNHGKVRLQKTVFSNSKTTKGPL
jgi:hypothetical protein